MERYGQGQSKYCQQAVSQCSLVHHKSPAPRLCGKSQSHGRPTLPFLHCSGTILDINLIWHEMILRITEHRLQFHILLSSITGNSERSEQSFTAAWPYESSPLYRSKSSRMYAMLLVCWCSDFSILALTPCRYVKNKFRQRCYFHLQI